MLHCQFIGQWIRRRSSVFRYRSAEKLEQVDAIQSFVRMVNQHPSPRNGSQHHVESSEIPTRLKKPARRASVYFCGGSLPWSDVLSVMQLTPSFVAVWRSESLVSLVYRVNAWRTSSVLIAGV